ncbi:MAG: type II CRISPR-associated endonuclease Cas1, partial [Methylophilaceae bacterium]|nr:type II CRISPR-associated endonuclease Cas1 [Methylophilaceae bacterium]
VLCLHHHSIKISVQALQNLAEAGASVLVTDAVHHPCAWLLPQVGNGDLVRRLHQQILLDNSEIKGVLWQTLIKARLNTQAINLRVLNRKGALRLERLAQEVLPEDKTKCEGKGAKHYWACLFEAEFSREKQGAGDAINSRLNFGYAVLRAMIARGLVIAGLNPALGVGHCNMENPFNLADDFIEPYRFVVERYVAKNYNGEFNSQARKEILGFISQEIKMKDVGYRLPSAINESIASFVRVLDGRSKHLSLPEDILNKT